MEGKNLNMPTGALTPEIKAAGKVEEFEVVDRKGVDAKITCEKDAKGQVVRMVEDKKLNMMMYGRQGIHDYRSQVDFTYDENGNIVHEIENSPDISSEVKRTFDANNRLTEEVSKGETFGNWYQATSRNDYKETKKSFAYDEKGRLVRESEESGPGHVQNWRDSETKYDEQNRVVEQTYEDDFFKHTLRNFTYDENGEPLTCEKVESYAGETKEDDEVLHFNNEYKRWEK